MKGVWLGQYQIIGELGRGGMGAVFRAQAPTGQVVAIKVLLNPGARNAVERFDRERRLLTSLGIAEGFVPLLDAGMARQGPFIVMPFIPGGTLSERLRKGELSIGDTVALGKSLAASLARAHEKGIIHRDLKPQNILFTAEGRPLLADLGLAKHFRSDVMGASQSVALTREGTSKGTVGYMPPEQVRDTKNVKPAADVFALGVILYECLLGGRLFEGETVHNVIVRIIERDIPKAHKVRRDTPTWLSRVIWRCMDPEPQNRYADGAALLEALQAEEEGGGGPPLPLVFAGIGALVAVLALVLILVLNKPSEEPEPAPPEEEQTSEVEPEQPPEEKTEWFRTDPYCRGFQESHLTRLRYVHGEYAWRLRNQARCMALLPSGEQALVGGSDGAVALVDLKTGESPHLDGFSLDTDIDAVAVSPNGKLAVVGTDVLFVWRLGKRHQLLETHGLKKPITALCFSPTGREVLCSVGSTIHVWSVSGESLKKSAQLKGHKKTIRCLAISATGDKALSGGDDRTIKLWDLVKRREVSTLTGHEHTVSGVAFHPDEKQAVSSSYDKTLALWDLASGAQIKVTKVAKPAYSVALSPRATHAVAGLEWGDLAVWSLEGRGLRTISGHWHHVRAAAFTPDGQRIVSASRDCNVKVWSRTGEELASKPGGGHQDWVASVAFTPDGNRLVSGSHDETIKVWDVLKPTAKPALTLRGHESKINWLGIAPDGRTVVTASDDKTVRLWDLVRARERGVLKGHTDIVRGIAVSPNGRWAVSGARDKTLRLWDLETRTEIQSLAGHKDWINTVVFTPDGERFVSGSHDKKVKLWATSGEEKRVMNHGNIVYAVAVSPDGSRMISAGMGRSAKLWDLESGSLLLLMDGHQKRIGYVAFSPDGRRAATACHDQAIRIWDLAAADGPPQKQTPLAEEADVIHLGTSHDYPLSVAWSPNGKHIAVGTGRGMVLQFELK